MAKYENVYFIGIGGIGMSAEARYFKFKGFKVSGYDRTPSDLTHKLEEEGIEVHYEDRPDLIPQDKEKTLVVYTPAIPAELEELQFVKENGYRVLKRSRLLGEITEGQRCLAVSGTHGKTTTSTLIAHILTQCGEGCTAFLGGISKNYRTNMLVSKTETVVAEADEFDHSFLQLHPEIAVISAMDADHLDIYGNLANYQQAFRDFAAQVSGTVIAKAGLPVSQADTKARLVRYAFEGPADYYGKNISPDESGHYSFDLVYPEGEIKGIRVGIPGWVNVENSVAAAAVCLIYGLSPEAVKDGIGTFKGVWRRLDFHINTPELVYVDDYAHHPQELEAAISSIRGIFPKRKLTAIFQPHLYSRTRDLAEGFAKALSAVDKLILLDIDGTLTNKDKVITPRTHDALIAKEPVDILATFGAGNIDRFIEPITALLEGRLR